MLLDHALLTRNASKYLHLIYSYGLNNGITKILTDLDQTIKNCELFKNILFYNIFNGTNTKNI
jgi:hypothetical protein